MAKKPNIADYIYCDEHDIFYNKQLKEDAERQWQEQKQKEEVHFGPMIDDCPMCAQATVMKMMSFGAPRGRSQREGMMSVRRLTSGSKKPKKIIELRKTKV